ncbi:MAG: zinc ribbon domain-containing protein [Candidatus Saganbacteria bacterium]|nr:zinc ribbon domain-containing protein [Candidatus Saganbacteria bacterium]
MPTYEYKCASCGKTFEEFQSIKDKPLKECNFCKGPVRRMIHAAGIVFKGSGFYVTDNTRDKKTAETYISPPKKKTEPKQADKK